MIDFLLLLLQSVVTLILAISLYLMGRSHKRELAALREESRVERDNLLDRIMANNIHEYKVASGAADIKRSENGNFLKDRMERAAKKYADQD